MDEADYLDLIDDETWEFIRASARHFPPDSARLALDMQRALHRQMCRAFRAAPPGGPDPEDRSFGGVPCRLHATGSAPGSVVFLHGGGFVLGDLDSEDDLCAEIAAATGLRVISVGYRLAPEHVHPAAFQDALAATKAVALAFPGPLVLVGHDAGGSLAASVAHALRGRVALSGQVLICPALGGNRDRGSYLTHATAPMLSRQDVLSMAAIRHGGREPAADPTSDALRDTDFRGLPPTLVVTAQCDPLSDDGRAYRDAIRAAAGRARWIEEPGLVHGFLRGRHRITRAAQSFARITAAVTGMSRGQF
ncbi:alpha/beta hydrolase [Cereibacter sphaeroides]|uniref:alpha/beta hydrolase n=1 Tax=Cereibacter sphaeroides TaxID=1063 RepID=UPI001F462F06|nr:alpha/beta hydrolase [Cereibacter sphaeroides]MCE6957783.1 alpha/beta hydrolase [Cereibacter sphaeroides]MCE6967304.1 alpha/beta hydrolase [Cereibacter sphaeroides]MCE6971544.1 alpha/beta hydrolase [Cereibacter sphaeroides]